MNSIFLHGRLVRDPELKTYTNAKGESGSVCNITVAVDRRMGEESDFFVCKCYGKRADAVNKFFSKGKEILVMGEMQCRKFQAKDGTNRYAWEVTFDQFDFCGSKKDGDTPVDKIPEGMTPIDDDDIPF